MDVLSDRYIDEDHEQLTRPDTSIVVTQSFDSPRPLLRSQELGFSWAVVEEGAGVK
jgi:hypothetical protein